MLRKLLKYDIRYILKGWIAMAIMSFLLSVLGGFCAAMLENRVDVDKEGIFILGIVISVLFIMFMAFIPFVLSLYRFYQNLYTDEGYLTFTLPVRKHEILLSKYLFSIITIGASGLVISIDVGMIFGVWHALTPDVESISPVSVNPSDVIVAILILLIIAFSVSALISLIFVIISVASRISKKLRGVFAVIVFYGIGIIFSSIIVSVATGVGENAVRWSDLIPAASQDSATVLLLLAICLVMALVSTVLYLAEYRLLDKHLNLF